MRISCYILLALYFFAIVSCDKESEVPAPVVDYFNPEGGKPGTLVTVTGKNFGDDPQVFINETPASRIRKSNPEEIIFEVPQGAINGRIKVSNGSVSGLSPKTFLVYLPPAIHSYSPESGDAYTLVTITGTNFTENSYAVFGDEPAIAYDIYSTSLKVNVPENAVSGKLSVVTLGGVVTSTSDFIANAPELNSVTSEFTKLPFSVSGEGHPIALEGKFSKIASKNTVRMNGVVAEKWFSTENKIVINAPKGVTTGKISVTEGTYTVTHDQVIDIPSGAWKRTTDFPGERRINAQVFAIGNDAYCGTGLNPVGSIFLNDFWKFNAQTKTWSRIADMPSAGRYGAIAFAINGKGYVGGGAGNTSNDFWEYDPLTNTWDRKADLPEPLRRWSFSINGKGYVFNSSGCQMWEYDPQSDTWTKRAAYPATCHHDGVSFAVDDKIYVGATGAGNEFWEYDPSTDGWTQKPTYAGGPMNVAVSFSLNGAGYCGAGESEEDMWKYTPQQNVWTPSVPFPFAGLSRVSSNNLTFTIGNKAYVGLNGGASGIANYLFEFTP